MGKSIINLFFITIKNVAYHVNTFSEGAMLHNLFLGVLCCNYGAHIRGARLLHERLIFKLFLGFVISSFR